MTRSIKGLMLAASAAAVLTFSAFASPSQATTLKWITYKPQNAGDAQAVSMQWFVDEFKKRTGGKTEIQMFWGGSVAKDKEIPDALSGGAGDIGDIITPYFPDKFPLNNAIGYFIPQPHSTIEIAELMHYWYRAYPQFDAELAKYNLKAIGFRPLASYGIICNKPINSVADFKGKRIRTYGFAYPALVHALGATPVSMSSSDGYQALERGILDCSPIDASQAHGWKYDEVAKYFIEVPIGASFGHLITMNLNSYKKLDEQTRSILDGLAQEYPMRWATEIDMFNKKVYADWKKQGVTVIRLPADSLNAAMKDPGVKAVQQKWVDKAKAAGLSAEQVKDIVDEITTP
jgi:TRAP-type C4-dicarboxylate transport system substrate-binding protein